MAVLAEIVRDDRRTDSRCLAALFLAVEQAKRILVKSCLAVFTELALLGFEEFDELLPILRTAVRIADGVQMEIEILQSEFMENFASHRDDFCIRERRGRTEDFQTKLVEFTVAAGLGTVIAEHGADVEHLMHLLVSIHLMFQIRADSRRCIFRAQGDRAIASVLEGIHFLRHDVGGIADAALK